MRYHLSVLALACLIFASIADEGKAAEGSFNAQSYHPIATRSALAVRPWDNSAENLELAKEIERVLKDRGFTIDQNAALVLSFEMSDILGNWSQGERRSILEVDGHGGRRGGENAKVRLNLYESNRGGMFNMGRKPAAVVPSKYQIEMTVDRKGGPRHWQGRAAADLTSSSGFELVKSMIPLMVEELGNTVKQRSFTTR